jgi:hypothetical protein
VTINRQAVSGKIVHEEGFLVQVATESPETNNAIKMEVGIEDCLHIEFEYNKSKYHLQDVVLGKIFFLLVRIKIKNMELAIIRRESTGKGATMYNESETVAKFEIMDGAPVRGARACALTSSALTLPTVYTDNCHQPPRPPSPRPIAPQANRFRSDCFCPASRALPRLSRT